MDTITNSIKQQIQEFRQEHQKNMIMREDFSRLLSPKSIEMTTMVDDQQYTTEYQILSNDILDIEDEDFDFDFNLMRKVESKPLPQSQISDLKERYENINFMENYSYLKSNSKLIERRPNNIPRGYINYLKNEFSDYEEEDYYFTTLKDEELDQKYTHTHGWLYEYLVFYSITLSSEEGSRYYYWLKNRHNINHRMLPQFTFDNSKVPINMILSMFHIINPRIKTTKSEVETFEELYSTFNFFVDWLLWSIGYPYMNETIKKEGVNPKQYSEFILEDSHNILIQMNWEVLYLWKTNFLQDIWELLFEDKTNKESKEKIKQNVYNQFRNTDINQHITWYSENLNSNYLLELSNYSISLCSMAYYDQLTEDIQLKISTIISYFYIPWSVIPPNDRSIKDESIIKSASNLDQNSSSLIKIDEDTLGESKFPKNTYPILVLDSKTRNESLKTQLNLKQLPSEIDKGFEEGFLTQNDSSEIQKEEFISVGEGEPIALGEGQPLSVGEGQPLSVGEGQPLSVGEGKPLSVGEGKPLSVGEGQPINVGEGQPINVGEGEIINSNLSESENSQIKEGFKKQPLNLSKTDKEERQPLNLPRNEKELDLIEEEDF